MMLKVRKLLAGLITLVLLVSISPLTSAQQAPTGSGLSISPTISEFTIKPGESNTVKITLKNVTVDDVVAQGVVNDFTSDGVTGNPKIITDPNVQSPNSIKKFVATLSNIPLAKGEQKNITVGLNIPADTSPGAYFGIIRYKAVPTGTNAPAPGQVALTASVGTIVLITVPGNLREQVQLTAVHVYRGARESSLFFTRPNKVGVEIKNFGNGFVQPFGTVEIQNTFGKAVDTLQFNNPKQLGNILPSSNRIFLNGISSIKQPGRYKVTANVAYGAGSQVLTLTKTIWYIPVWLAIAIVLVILALAFLVYRTYRHYKHDKRHSYRGR
jgi:hypothetical protein